MISTKKRKNCHKDYLPQLVFQQPSVYIENSKLSCILHDGIISWPVTHLDHPQESKSAQFYRNGLAGKKCSRNDAEAQKCQNYFIWRNVVATLPYDLTSFFISIDFINLFHFCLVCCCFFCKYRMHIMVMGVAIKERWSFT